MWCGVCVACAQCVCVFAIHEQKYHMDQKRKSLHDRHIQQNTDDSQPSQEMLDFIEDVHHCCRASNWVICSPFWASVDALLDRRFHNRTNETPPMWVIFSVWLAHSLGFSARVRWLLVAALLASFRQHW